MSDVVIDVERLGKRYDLGRAARMGLLASEAAARRQAAGLVRGSPARSNGVSGEAFIWALKDVSFQIEQGEKVGVIGRNGAGKSTLLKILSRITTPTEGRARIRGRVGSLLEVGTGFHPELTGRENVSLNGAILGMRRAEVERKFEQIVTFAEVERFIDVPVKHYSSGMYVRLAFAVAAHLDPEILLVDEVLAVGDVAFQRKCLERMEEGSREGRTVLFVSHNMSAITSLCRRTIFLSDGQLAADGPADEVVAQYLHTVRQHQHPVEGRISLVDHPGRRKPYERLVRLTYCRLLDGDGNPVTSFKSGKEARIALGYEMSAKVETAGVTFAVIISDSLQRRIFSCSSDLVGAAFGRLAPAGEVVCTIPRLPLVPGIYLITVACKVGAVHSDGVYDAVEFEVAGGDFFGTRRLPIEGSGAVLVSHEWTVTG